MKSNLNILIIKGLRKLYSKIFKLKTLERPDCEKNADVSSRIIYDKLMDDKPCMIARFGSNELLCMVTFLGIKESSKNTIDYVTGKTEAWWWNDTNLDNMYNVAGFYPKEYSAFEKFCELMNNDIDEIDVLGSWLANENYFKNKIKNADKVHLELLNPYFSDVPWTRALENKKILVVHPFAETIERQYKKRHLLFENNLLPEFELKTIKAVQSIAGTKTPFKTWFEALNFMKDEIDKVDYDICLIGCGAYGFPLAAHVKRNGKKSFHLGGTLQLLFGIKGKRWGNPNYNEIYNYSNLMNEHWVYPDNNDKPTNANIVEGACYW